MIRELDDKTLVAGQIRPEQLPELKQAGVTLIVNNRADGEDPGQPTSEAMEAAVRAAGIDYRHVPIARGLGPSHVTAMREAIEAAGDGKLLAYCRSGQRSVLAWALARREEGASADELKACAERAGFSLDPICHLL